MPKLKITRVMIERTPGFSRRRWFIDLMCDDGSSSGIGNADSEHEVRELQKRVVIIGQSWTLRPEGGDECPH